MTTTQIFIPVTFNKTFDNNGNYYVITAEVTNDTSKSIPAIYVERKDEQYVLSKEELIKLLKKVWDEAWEGTTERWNNDINDRSEMDNREKRAHDEAKNSYINTLL